MLNVLPEFEEPAAVPDDMAALRKLAGAVIREAFNRIDKADHLRRRLQTGDRGRNSSETLTRTWSILRDLERDLVWFRSDGFAFWVSALDLDPASVEAMPEAYERRCRPVADELGACLMRVDPAGFARRRGTA